MTLSTHLHTVDTSTVTGTIVFGGACAVDDTIIITDAAGTSKTFTAKGSTTAGSLQFINTDAAAAATALKLCIDNAAGFGTNSITVVDNSSGTLTITLVVNGTYRFKNKGEINPADDITNVTFTQFGSAAGVEDKDGHTILNGGNIASAKGNSKSLVDIVKGIKRAGSVVLASTGSANKPGVEAAHISGTRIAYNPSSPDITRSSSDTGFVIRAGVANNIASVSDLNPLFTGGSDTTSRLNGSIHVPNGIHKYSRKGTWATTIFDAYGGNLLQSDGTAKAGITGRGSDASLATDNAATPTRAIPGEMTLLFNHVTFTTNNLDYSAITG
tara:strand:+ start:4167 stop:5150 length:984 start_codon:yes stop_codon:yes gene_type:complete